MASASAVTAFIIIGLLSEGCAAPPHTVLVQPLSAPRHANAVAIGAAAAMRYGWVARCIPHVVIVSIKLFSCFRASSLVRELY